MKPYDRTTAAGLSLLIVVPFLVFIMALTGASIGPRLVLALVVTAICVVCALVIGTAESEPRKQLKKAEELIAEQTADIVRLRAVVLEYKRQANSYESAYNTERMRRLDLVEKLNLANMRNSNASANNNPYKRTPPPPPPPVIPPPQFSEQELRTLLQLVHPDKHGGKESAQRMTEKILRLRG